MSDLVQQSACPQVFALAPSRLQDAIPSSPSLPGGWDLHIKAADGDLKFVLPLLRGALPGAVCAPCGSSSACDEEASTWKGHLRPPPPTLPSCLSGLARPAQVGGRGPSPRSLRRALVPGVAGRVGLAQRTLRSRRIGNSRSSKRQRGLGAAPPCHPDVPLSPRLPTGWADSGSVRGRG